MLNIEATGVSKNTHTAKEWNDLGVEIEKELTSGSPTSFCNKRKVNED